MDVIIILLSILCLFLLYQVIIYYVSLRKMHGVIDEFRKGNHTRRLFLKSNSTVTEASISLNNLLDEFQVTHERRKYLEQLRVRMISDLSHDIRTPLTSMLGYVEALLNDHTLSGDEKDQYLKIVSSKGSALYSLMDGFFEISKLEEDQNVKSEKVNVTEKIKQVLVTFYHEFVKAGITPDINVPEAPVYIVGDDRYIERILQNLVSNALKYGSDGGSIGISLTENQNKVYIEVWDNGKGIGKNDMDLIFERLYTAEASRNQGLRGSGLGLAIVKRLAEKMNGEIKVISIPYERTSFLLRFSRPA